MTELALELRDLSHRYSGGRVSIDRLSLGLRPGEVMGLIGPNGAGKSTLLKLASGLLRPTGGKVLLAGEDCTAAPDRAAAHVCLMPDPLGVYTDLTVGEYLHFFARLFSLEGHVHNRRIDDAVSQLDLGRWFDHEVESLSAGWQRRLALARVLLANSPIMLLDEPAAGLDVTARTDLLTLIRNMQREGRTMIVSSHILTELEDLADRFAVLDQGRWVTLDSGLTSISRDALGAGAIDNEWLLRTQDDASAIALAHACGIDAIPIEPSGLRIRAADADAGQRLLSECIQRDIKLLEYRHLSSELSHVVTRALDGGTHR